MHVEADGTSVTVTAEPPGATSYFAAGSPDGPRSSTWRVWTSKNSDDWYAAARLLAGVQKWSFHQSGIWRHAFVSDEAARPYLDEGRLLDRWERPPECYPGWTRALQIWVPVDGLRVGVDEAKGPRGLKFIDPGGAGTVCFELLQGELGARVDALPSLELFDYLQLPQGGSVLIAAHLEPSIPPMQVEVAVELDFDPSRLTSTTRIAMSAVNAEGERVVVESAVLPVD